MSEHESPPPDQPDIGIEFVKKLYTDCKLETNAPQPIYLLYKDTIKTFLHEKIALLALDAKIIGLIGIEVSILAALFTAKFEKVWIIEGPVIHGTFLAFFFVLAYFLARDVKRWLQNWRKLSVDSLTDELGGRGSMIKGGGRSEATDPTDG